MSGPPSGDLRLPLHLLESIEGAVIATTIDRTIIYWNRHAQRLYGWSASEVVGRPVTDVIPVLAPPDLRAEINAKLRQDGSWSGEVSVYRRDGSVVPVLLTSSALYDERGDRVGTVGVSFDISERKRIEDELRRRQLEFQTVVENAPDIVFRIDRDYRYRYVNKAIEPVTDRPAGDFIGKTHAELGYSQETVELWRRQLDTVFESGQEAIFISDSPRRDDMRTYQSRIVPEFDAQGRVVSVLGIARDITPLKRAEEELRRSRDELDVILRGIAEGITVQEQDGRLIYANEAAAQLVGFPSADALVSAAPGEIVKRFQLFDESGNPLNLADLPGRRAMRGEPGAPMVVRYRATDTEEERWSIIQATPVLDEQGTPRLAINIFRDITEMKLAELRLREAEVRYRTLVEQVPAVIYITSLGASPTLLYLSPQIQHLTGYTPAEAVRNPNLRHLWIHPDDRDRVLAADDHAIRTLEPYSVEYRIVARDGRIVWVRNESVVVRDDQGRPQFWHGIIVDLTRSKQQEEAQRFLADAGTLLASSLDHEATLQQLAQLAVPRLADYCVVHVLEPSGSIRRLALAHVSSDVEWLMNRFEELADEQGFEIIPRTVIRTGTPRLIEEMTEDVLAQEAPSPDLAELVRTIGTVSFISAPLRAHGRVFGAISLTSLDPGRRFGQQDLDLAEELARRAALAISNAQLYSSSRRAQERLEFLSEASSILTSSLDVETTLRNLAHLAVSHLADYCVVDMLDEDGTIQRLATAHADPAKEELVRALENDYPPDPDRPNPVMTALRTGRIQLDEVTPDTMLQQMARDERQLTILRQLGPQSHLVVPMVARGETLGSILYVLTEPGRRFQPEEIALAGELAQRAAMAVSNARLYRNAQRAQQRLAFLVEASTVLASSLDYETTLSSVARLAVPWLADWCAVDIVDVGGSIRRLASVAADLEKQAISDELLARFQFDPNRYRRLAKVLATGRPELVQRVTEDVKGYLTHDPDHELLIRALDPRTVMIVPLTVRGTVVGALNFASWQPDRMFNQADLDLAQELARRAAVAFENATLYREVEQRAVQVEAVSQASRQLAEASLDLNVVLDTVTQTVVELTGDVCDIRFLDEVERVLHPAAIRHPRPEIQTAMEAYAKSVHLDSQEKVYGQVIRTRQAVLIPRVLPGEFRRDLNYYYAEPLQASYGPGPHQFEVHSILVVPLRIQGRVIGIIALTRETPNRPYTEDDRRFVQDLADRAALAIENARLFRQAQEAIRAREEFLSIAAHEFRTPLTTVKGYLQLLDRQLQQDALDSGRLRQSMANLTSQMNRFEVLVNDLLDVSRLQQGRLQLRLEACDLLRLASDLHERLAYAPERKPGHHLVLDVPEPVEGVWDPSRIEQVMSNLVFNALKYSEAGRVLLGVYRHDDHASIVVSDQGIGITPEEQALLFEPFYRGDRARGLVGGAGLGLYITKQIINQHGGRIEVRSTLGQGTTFSVELPLITPTELADPTDSVAAPLAGH